MPKSNNHSHSSLSMWRRCRYRYYLDRVKGLESPQSLGQARGSAGHKAMEQYYGQGRDPKAAIEAAWESYSSTGFTPDMKDWELLEGVLERYFQWASRMDSFVVLETEHKFELDIDGRTFVGFIDGVVKTPSGQIWLLEHKFNKQASTSHLQFDPQVSTYMMAAVLEGLSPVGVLYNIVRVSDGPTAKTEPAVRVPVYRNKEGLAYFAQEIRSQIQDIEDYWKDDPERIPYRTLTKDCAWDCPYSRICLELNDSGNADHIVDKLFPEGQLFPGGGDE